MSKLVCDKQRTPLLRLAKNEEGYVLITALLIMVILTILGVAATNTAIIEMQISANERDYKRNFYRAEGAVMEAVQIFENETDREELLPAMTTTSWLKSITDPVYKPVYYSGIPPNLDSLMTVAGLASLDDSTNDVHVDYAAFSRGVAKGAKGASLSMSGTTVHEYSVYGQSAERAGEVMIEIGYKKRF